LFLVSSLRSDIFEPGQELVSIQFATRKVPGRSCWRARASWPRPKSGRACPGKDWAQFLS